MLKPADIPRFAKLGLTASIQPQHAMDDRDVITRFWANPGGIPYAFKALHDAGGGDHARRPLDVLLFAWRMIPDKECMRIPHTNPIGNRPPRRQGVRRHTAMTYR